VEGVNGGRFVEFFKFLVAWGGYPEFGPLCGGVCTEFSFSCRGTTRKVGVEEEREAGVGRNKVLCCVFSFFVNSFVGFKVDVSGNPANVKLDARDAALKRF
jgi:hypothetical protein